MKEDDPFPLNFWMSRVLFQEHTRDADWGINSWMICVMRMLSFMWWM